jgi:hypothetical protein
MNVKEDMNKDMDEDVDENAGGRGCGRFAKHRLLPPSPLLTSRNLCSLLDRDTFRLAHLDVDISLLHIGTAVLS